MKINGIAYLGFTTVVLLTTILFAAMDFAFGWIFLLTIIGQGFLVFAVYKVLTDNYTTTKAFEDYYEDRPDLGL